MFQLFSQVGIAVELLGAIWLFYTAYQSHKTAKNSIVHQLHWGLEDSDGHDSLGGRLSIALQEIAGEFEANARDQWRAQMFGFALFGAGLALQFTEHWPRNGLVLLFVPTDQIATLPARKTDLSSLMRV